jgi:hypothetical protein
MPRFFAFGINSKLRFEVSLKSEREIKRELNSELKKRQTSLTGHYRQFSLN